MCSRAPELVVGDGRLAPTCATPRRRGREAHVGALLDQVALELAEGGEKVRQRAAEPVEFPDDQHLALAHVVDRGPEAFAVGASARDAVLEHLGAPGRRERVELEREVLVERAHRA